LAAFWLVRGTESQPGYLGRESLDGPGGHELTVVYYATEEAILQWREHAEHLVAQRFGRERWYEAYEVRIARVERSYRFQRGVEARWAFWVTVRSVRDQVVRLCSMWRRTRAAATMSPIFWGQRLALRRGLEGGLE